MSLYSTDFTGQTVGLLTPSGWTRHGDRNAEVDARFEVTAAHEVQATISSGFVRFRTLSWDALNADGGRANIEILAVAEVRDVSIAEHQGVSSWLRGSGTTGALVGYMAHLNSNGLRIVYGNGFGASSSNYTVLANDATKAPAVGEVWAWRFRVNGSNLSLKAWKPADPADPEADEPGPWDLTTTHATITAAGWNGIGTRASGSSHLVLGRYQRIAVATAGDTATFGAAPATPEGQASLGSTTGLDAIGSRPSQGQASLASSTTLDSAGTRTSTGQASLVSASTLDAAGERTATGQASLGSTTTLDAAGSAPAVGAAEGQASLGSTTTLDATGARTSTGQASLSTVTMLDTAGARASQGQATLASTTTLNAAGPAPELVFDAPPERTLTIKAEDRVYVIQAEDRTLTIPHEDRTVRISR